MPKLRRGHAPGHVRETFLNAVEAYMEWRSRRSGPEPTVEYEVNYKPRQIPISRACGLVWNCTDTMPGDIYHELTGNFPDLIIKTSTYAGCAQAMLRDIQQRTAVAA